jgi:radical SAM superfamily enzyme YgiQ (UPF0313 family)
MFKKQGQKRFTLILIKPSHYDDDGYPIQWFRSAFPSNTLAVMNGLALDCQERRVLGADVDLVITALDETNTRIRPARIARQIGGNPGLVCLVGVQSNQFPRALDLARPLRAASVQICVGGFHVSGCLAMLPEMPPELKQALDLGISLFAGEAEGRFDVVLRDAWNGKLRPLYNYLADLPPLEGAPLPILSASRIKRNSGKFSSFDAGRGCPFQCSFCTIINVQGRKTRQRSADDVEQIVRRNLAQGINRFFITDDNFARNRRWEAIFDRLIAMREREKLDIKFAIQADTMCHRIPRFIEKAGRAGIKRVFLGLESINPEHLISARKSQNDIAEYRSMLLAWKLADVTTIAGYILGFPADTPESIVGDIQAIQRELPLDLMEFSCLTPLPGSEDHQCLYTSGAPLDPDLNRYDIEHATTAHPLMSKAQWEQAYRDAYDAYYTPAHFETVLRRSVPIGKYTGGNLPMLMNFFYGYCIKLENVSPIQGGYLRRRYRRDRRPTLPVESPFVFYLRSVASLGYRLYQHILLAWDVWYYGRLLRRLRRDPAAYEYTDAALAPLDQQELQSARAQSMRDHRVVSSDAPAPTDSRSA